MLNMRNLFLANVRFGAPVELKNKTMTILPRVQSLVLCIPDLTKWHCDAGRSTELMLVN